MSDYVIGDVQGCYEPLQRLLAHINFNQHQDRLWFVGDLVNRGPDSLSVLRFIKNLPIPARITLGNHDLYLLAKIFTDYSWSNHDDSLDEVLLADDAEELGHWLRRQSILYYEPALNVVMCHAGIAPQWDLALARSCARELEDILSGIHFRDFLTQMYGNEPSCWSSDLQGMERLRAITNYFTRMRFCDRQGCLALTYKGKLEGAPAALFPWYAVPDRKPIDAELVFGHWAALQGQCSVPIIYALDTGCFWGGALTALRLQDKQRFSVPGLKV